MGIGPLRKLDPLGPNPLSPAPFSNTVALGINFQCTLFGDTVTLEWLPLVVIMINSFSQAPQERLTLSITKEARVSRKSPE